MAAPAIAKLGHIGLFVRDVQRQKAFYRDVLGLTVSDEAPGTVFMSSQPETEHHELLLREGRSDPEAKVVQQMSFRCNSLDDVIGYYRRFKQHDVKIERILSHGNAVGLYFFDPEGNRCEVYWPTGLKAHQPFAIPVDLDRPQAELMADIHEQVRQYGATGTGSVPAR
jgi:catechol-2,3-dioxygenase